MPQSKPSAVFLLGPTASGKTDLAVQWVQASQHAASPFEIISVDSAMVYRGMDIGTGKPTSEILAIAPHHLINIREPAEPYSVAEFRTDALRIMANITARGHVPLLVGGTMLYVRALQQGLSILPSAHPDIRQALSEEAESLGWQVMHQRLAAIDPVAALRIHPNDPQRIQRALEIYAVTGQSMSDLCSEQGGQEIGNLEAYYNIQTFILGTEALEAAGRQVLHERIAKRFENMLAKGFIEEVSHLLEALQGVQDYKNLPSMRSVGYRQVCQYLEGALSYDEMVYQAVAATRQLAKRQCTYLRKLTSVNHL